LRVDPPVARLQLFHAVELLHELPRHGLGHRELTSQEVMGLTWDEWLEHAGGHHVIAPALGSDVTERGDMSIV
jgi:hypothetical protein